VKQVNNRIASLDFWRAISVIFVIMHHAYRELSWYRGGRIFAWMDNFDISSLGVTCFLIMSGLGLTFNHNSNESAVSFFKNRIKNLMPYFWMPYVAIALFLFFIVGRPFLQSGDFVSILATFIGIDGWTMDWLIPYSSNYLIGEWYFGCLIGLYLMYPLLRKIMQYRPYAGWILLGISVPLSIGLEHVSPWLHAHIYIWNYHPYFNPLVLLPLFLFGMCWGGEQ
jgi:peptidoglycan/LPS O-acetylase OafA/YrhL